ncbi:MULTISPECIES: malonic semialdehyde reductase [unclassified Azospirillum]|jgi:3-hydroxypropanoate dehydrogenase|uniref:malonic semialdehyde reductase n=1 Tax=unclassified Azospirillum TaxID=2630922 RepID=UPI000B6CD144|nr:MULTISPECIES: malonic semialdehyde reductase [unclassified Azospirillum]SNS62326.1 3-hydroxypropanoate dehydrogenase [Azospirillum sp. RU38E]SNS81528.1 3-hydroxypropanoate dehydrogenase [Azospirillum sp. RU37A]
MSHTLDQAGAELLFTQARTHNAWLDKPVDPALLHRIHDLLKWGPTSANCSPLRVLFLTSAEAKEKLRPALSQGNLAKTMTAPVVAVLAYDNQFYDHLPRLFPHTDARSWFTGDPAVAAATAFRNGTLQAGYFILAARAVGLDCGPMSGFDAGQVNASFFPDGRYQVNFLCNLGYGDPAGLHPRSPRFDFADVCQIL